MAVIFLPITLEPWPGWLRPSGHESIQLSPRGSGRFSDGLRRRLDRRLPWITRLRINGAGDGLSRVAHHQVSLHFLMQGRAEVRAVKREHAWLIELEVER